MEKRLGHGLGGVRLHTDAPAAVAAQSLDASAVTTGQHILFASGAYAPGRPHSWPLLAHELVHTVQHQAFAHTATPPLLSRRSDAAERQAETLARAIALGSATAAWVPAAPVSLLSLAPASVTSPAVSTAGRIISERVAPDGLVIDIEVGNAVDRLGLENSLPRAVEVSLPGWQRAHQVGPGLGAESGEGIRYAPPEVNLKYQNSGIEAFIREFNAQRAPGVRLYLRTLAQSHPGTRRLSEITYRLSAAYGDGAPQALFETSIEISNSTLKPRVTLGQPEILGDYHQFLAPRGVPPPGSSGQTISHEEPQSSTEPASSSGKAAPEPTQSAVEPESTKPVEATATPEPPVGSKPSSPVEPAQPAAKAAIVKAPAESPSAAAPSAAAPFTKSSVAVEAASAEVESIPRGSVSLKVEIGGALLQIALSVLLAYVKEKLQESLIEDAVRKLQPEIDRQLQTHARELLEIQLRAGAVTPNLFANVSITHHFLESQTTVEYTHMLIQNDAFVGSELDGLTVGRQPLSMERTEVGQWGGGWSLETKERPRNIHITFPVPLRPYSPATLLAEIDARIAKQEAQASGGTSPDSFQERQRLLDLRKQFAPHAPPS
jgi:hypothetical protein